MVIRSIKSFNAALETLRAGEVDSFGNSNHDEIITALRRFRDRASGRFSELSAYINEASEAGFDARMRNRANLAAELSRKAREESYRRQYEIGR